MAAALAVVGMGYLGCDKLEPNAFPLTPATMAQHFPDMNDVLARAAAPAGREPNEKVEKLKLRSGDQLFVANGCIACHNPAGGAFYANLAAAGRDPTKGPERIAAWIRNPQSFKPGTAMPPFGALVNETDAMTLGVWIKAGNPKPPTAPTPPSN
ncbi:MAG: c-type cytochrome [Deltaproteobacteria bacterium]|nr:c-type cytochrome [Deltaproteobacteria bacterium]